MLNRPNPPPSALVAHDGAPLLPHDALSAWHLDPFVAVALAAAAVLYLRGYRPSRDGRRHAYAFGLGLAALVLALMSPIDRLAGVLLSAHMIQHVLLVTVAAPLIAYAAPGAAIMRGLPGGPRRSVVAARRSIGLDVATMRRLRHPIARWLLFVATIWLWHASKLYGAAVDHELVHVAEHATFLATALLVWTAVLGPERLRAPDGAGILVVFLLVLQGVVLSALMTFAPEPWYEQYATPAPGWGLDPITDQHLAGVIMWVPAGAVYTAVGVALLVRWFHAVDGRLAATGSRCPPSDTEDDRPVVVGDVNSS